MLEQNATHVFLPDGLAYWRFHFLDFALLLLLFRSFRWLSEILLEELLLPR